MTFYRSKDGTIVGNIKFAADFGNPFIPVKIVDPTTGRWKECLASDLIPISEELAMELLAQHKKERLANLHTELNEYGIAPDPEWSEGRLRTELWEAKKAKADEERRRQSQRLQKQRAEFETFKEASQKAKDISRKFDISVQISRISESGRWLVSWEQLVDCYDEDGDDGYEDYGYGDYDYGGGSAGYILDDEGVLLSDLYSDASDFSRSTDEGWYYGD